MALEPVRVATEDAQSLRSEIWAGYRPYLREITTDTLISGTLYCGLWIFDWLVRRLPVHGWEANFIPHLHGVAVIAIFSVFSWLSIVDVYRIRKDIRR
jgi:hypothetical protein